MEKFPIHFCLVYYSHYFTEHFTKIFRLAKLDAELSYHACQFNLENVSRTGNVQWKNLTVFLAISCFSGGLHARVS
jgi:hypothetical protein